MLLCGEVTRTVALSFHHRATVLVTSLHLWMQNHPQCPQPHFSIKDSRGRKGAGERRKDKLHYYTKNIARKK